MNLKSLNMVKDEQSNNDNVSLIPQKDCASEFLSNERTFLAWIRTSIAVITLGFVIAKFGIWLENLSQTATPQIQQFRTEASVPTGIGMIIFGGLLSVLAAWRYHTVNLQIERGEVSADRGLIVMITLLVVILSLIMVVYMIYATIKF